MCGFAVIMRTVRDDCFESIIPLCYTGISVIRQDETRAGARYRKGRVLMDGKKNMEQL